MSERQKFKYISPDTSSHDRTWLTREPSADAFAGT